MGSKPNRRRQFFIKKEFQSKFIMLYALAVILVAGALTFSMNAYLEQSFRSHLFSSHIKIANIGEITNGVLLKYNLLVVGAIMAVIILVSLLMFKRLNAHFMRMEARIEAMGQGRFDLPPLPQSRFKEVSKLISEIEKTRSRYREQYGEISAALRKVESAQKQEGAEETLKEAYGQLNRMLKEVDLPERGG